MLILAILDSLVKRSRAAVITNYLTAVLSPLPVPGTDEDVRDVLPEPSLLVHGLTLGVVDDRQVHLLQHGGQRTV